MNIESRRQCENTQAKLRDLERLYESKQVAQGDQSIRDLTLHSIKKRINQLREEIARFEARVSTQISGK